MPTTRVPSAPLIALIEPDEAVLALLAEVLDSEGLHSVCWPTDTVPTLDGLCAFLTEHAPAVALLDIPPPYAMNWQFTRLVLRRLPELAVVVTTTDPAALANLPGNDGRVPILTKPFQLEMLLATVRRLTTTASD
jgi:CheY-like chemotaxis protein